MDITIRLTGAQILVTREKEPSLNFVFNSPPKCMSVKVIIDAFIITGEKSRRR